MNILARLALPCVLSAAAIGCAASGGGGPSSDPGGTHGPSSSAAPHASSGGLAKGQTVTAAQVRALAMDAADSYATAVEQACDQIRVGTKKPAIADWAWQTKIATSLAAFTNASGPQDAECLLDMVLFATLKRHAMEEHWIPTMLGDEGKPALEIYRRAEADVWAAAGRAMTREQLDELRALIEQWRQQHPGQHYVVHLRFANLASDLGIDAREPRGKAPDSLFGLLHVDPLAGLSPVTAEMRNYRAMSERMMYMAVRMPRVLGWQVEYAAIRATGTPEVHRVLDIADRVAGIAQSYPAEVSKERQAALTQVQELVKTERQAAIDQVNERVAGQRDAVTAELEKQGTQVRKIISDVSSLVAQAERAAANVNQSTSRTVVATEEAGRRTMTLGFTYVLILIVVLPLVLLLYRLAVKRWVAPRSPAPPPPIA